MKIMMKNQIGNLLKEGVDTLNSAGLENHYPDSRLILQHAGGLSHEQIVSDAENTVDENIAEKFHALLQERIKGKSVATIIGHKEFWGLDFSVNDDVLIPRPDSETLILAILEFFPNKNLPLKILDLGTGSGCLVSAVLSEYPKAKAVAVDISQDALNIANKNFHIHSLQKRIKPVKSNWLEQLSEQLDGEFTDGESVGKFDVIICNPPYIKSDDIDDLSVEVRDYEPRIALDGGADGLDCYRSIFRGISQVSSSLARKQNNGEENSKENSKKNGKNNCKNLRQYGKISHGKMFVEIGYDMKIEVSALAQSYNLKLEGIRKDLSEIERVMIVSF